MNDHLLRDGMFHTCEISNSTRQPRQLWDMDISLAKKAGDRGYYDVLGPMRHPSLRGAKYFVTFIHEYSGYSFVLFMKLKEEAAN